MTLNTDEQSWLDSVAGRITDKLARTSRRIKDSFPFVSIDGRYQDWDGDRDPLSWWTNSFWAGELWQMYRHTKDEYYRETAESCEKQMDASLYGFDGLHHDVGFMWSLTSVANFKLTGNDLSRRRAMLAASTLSARFNLKGGFIRAWNQDKTGWAIVDCMMNLPLLYWASIQTDDQRFANIARAHADTAIRTIQRPDGSVNHIVQFDPETGEVLGTPAGQGYEEGSSWSRGQAWALYGFALSYKYTKEVRYLDAAKRVAHYFIANVCDDWLPAIDFRSPSEPGLKDSTAGAIAACGLLEIADSVGGFEPSLYRDAAIKLLRTLDVSCGAWDKDEEGLLLHGSHAWKLSSWKYPNDTPIIYGDYYFVEAVMRLKGYTELFW